MGMRKVLLLACSAMGIYLLGRGGIMPLLDGSTTPFDYVWRPLKTANPFDIALGMVCLLLLTWVVLLGEPSRGITRSKLLRGIALGSAAMASVFLVVNFYTAQTYLFPELPAIVAVVGFLHAVVGITAGLLLLVRKDSRRDSSFPLAANSLVLAGTASVIFVPLFMW